MDEIAAVTDRPEDVIGLHFFSPANVMRLLEIIRGSKTSKDVVATAMKMAKKGWRVRHIEWPATEEVLYATQLGMFLKLEEGGAIDYIPTEADQHSGCAWMTCGRKKK